MFFFYCSGDQRDLHSFPTRRSSDLGNARGLLSLDPAGEVLIVAKCDSGMASAVAVEIDREGIPEIIGTLAGEDTVRSEEHTSELQSQSNLVCRLLLEKKKKNKLNEV